MEMKVFFQSGVQNRVYCATNFAFTFPVSFIYVNLHRKMCEFLFLFACAHYYDDSCRMLLLLTEERLITNNFLRLSDQNLQMHMEKLRLNLCNRSTSEITRSK